MLSADGVFVGVGLMGLGAAGGSAWFVSSNSWLRIGGNREGINGGAGAAILGGGGIRGRVIAGGRDVRSIGDLEDMVGVGGSTLTTS